MAERPTRNGVDVADGLREGRSAATAADEQGPRHFQRVRGARARWGWADPGTLYLPLQVSALGAIRLAHTALQTMPIWSDAWWCSLARRYTLSRSSASTASAASPAP